MKTRTICRTSLRRWRAPVNRFAGVFCTVVMAMTVVLIAPSTAASAYSVQGEAVTVEARVSGKEIALWLVDVNEPIGAVEFTVDGLSPLDGECEVEVGFGACNDQGGNLLVVAVNPTGFETATELATAKVDDSIDSSLVEINVATVANVAGEPLVAATTVVASPDAGGSIPTSVLLAVPLVAIVAGLLVWRVAGSRNKPQQLDR